jgi:hypothetical protein
LPLCIGLTMPAMQNEGITKRLSRLLIATLFAVLVIPAVRAGELRNNLSDQEFWGLISTLSESGDSFESQLMSNEDSAQYVLPALKRSVRRRGVYIGVGTEQNFTYIAALQPKIAFVIDIRRDNMLEHLMYKAIFELSADRAEFISRLFSRKRPAGLNSSTTVEALFEAYRNVEASSAIHEQNLKLILDGLVNRHKFRLGDTEKASIAGMLGIFRMAGPDRLTGQGDKNMSYAQLMAVTDQSGKNHGYLASEENFRIVRELQKRNLVIPVVGDFAGNKALAAVGRYLKERSAVVNVFYVSNVERYLFDQGRIKNFYDNIATLPLDGSSTFIRSVTVDISRRLGIPIPDGDADWRTFLFTIDDDLRSVVNGRIRTYPELFQAAR